MHLVALLHSAVGAGKARDALGTYSDALAQVKLYGNTVVSSTKTATITLKLDKLPTSCDAITNPFSPVYGKELARLGPSKVLPTDLTVGIWGVVSLSGNAIVDMSFYQGLTACQQQSRALLVNGFIANGELFS